MPADRVKPKECDHTWVLHSDWDGDPGIPNGTHTFYWMECMECGEEREATDEDHQQAADDWEQAEIDAYIASREDY